LDRRVEEYIRRREKLDPVMYPPLKTYKILRIPVIPFPSIYIGSLT